MPTGPNGEKRPADPVASANLVARVATALASEQYVDDAKSKAGDKGRQGPPRSPRRRTSTRDRTPSGRRKVVQLNRSRMAAALLAALVLPGCVAGFVGGYAAAGAAVDAATGGDGRTGALVGAVVGTTAVAVLANLCAGCGAEPDYVRAGHRWIDQDIGDYEPVFGFGDTPEAAEASMWTSGATSSHSTKAIGPRRGCVAMARALVSYRDLPGESYRDQWRIVYGAGKVGSIAEQVASANCPKARRQHPRVQHTGIREVRVCEIVEKVCTSDYGRFTRSEDSQAG